MRIKNSKSWVRYPLSSSLAGASFILLVSFLIRLSLHDAIEPYAPFHFFIVACIAIAYLYGYKLALVGTLVSTALGGYYFIKPYFSFGAPASSDWLQFFNFAAVTVIAILVIERLQRSIYSRNLTLKVMQSRYRISVLQKNDADFIVEKYKALETQNIASS
jgi:K+-sensing histidine kinase KdpD